MMPTQYLPEPWGAPRLYKGVNGGAVWLAREPATQADIDALKLLNDRVLIDDRTLCGRSDPNWTTYYEEMTARDAARSPWLRFRRWISSRW